MASWLKAEIEILISSLKKGKNYEEIAKCLNKTWSSVRNKSNCLGLKIHDFNSYDKEIICLNCEKKIIIKRCENNKFCSKSCSSSYTNKGKIKTQETKDKISKTLKLEEKLCSGCNKIMNRKTKWNLCFKCLGKDLNYKVRQSKATKGKTGGYRKGGGAKHHKGDYYNGIWMDSSWEIIMAKRFDELKIKWERNNSIFFLWVDVNNIQHKYYPDFYLPSLNKYIEVKGFWTTKIKDKMDRVIKQNSFDLEILESVKVIKEWNLQASDA